MSSIKVIPSSLSVGRSSFYHSRRILIYGMETIETTLSQVEKTMEKILKSLKTLSFLIFLELFIIHSSSEERSWWGPRRIQTVKRTAAFIKFVICFINFHFLCLFFITICSFYSPFFLICPPLLSFVHVEGREKRKIIIKSFSWFFYGL